MARGILGKKLGMTQIFEADGTLVPVTVVEAGPCVVLANKTEETDGYNAIQLGFGDIKEKHVNKPMKGFFDKAGVAPVKFVRNSVLLKLLNIKSAIRLQLTSLQLAISLTPSAFPAVRASLVRLNATTSLVVL